jgi:hypothetical protein
MGRESDFQGRIVPRPSFKEKLSNGKFRDKNAQKTLEHCFMSLIAPNTCAILTMLNKTKHLKTGTPLDL